MKPKQVNIMSRIYKIEYCNSAEQVDPFNKSENDLGAISRGREEIQMFDGGRQWQSVFVDLMHEVLHGIVFETGGPLATEDNHNWLNTYATAMADVLLRNGWVK